MLKQGAPAPTAAVLQAAGGRAEPQRCIMGAVKGRKKKKEYGFKYSAAQVGGAQGDFRCDEALIASVALL